MADRTCCIPNCGKPHEARGWCWAHYSRWRRHGDPLAGTTARGMDPIDRFLPKLNWSPHRFEGTRCLVWTAGLTAGGYGQFNDGTRNPIVAHRWLWQRWVGPIRSGDQLHHRCHNKLCVNPRHIESLAPSDHSRLHGGPALKVTCKHGHPMSEARISPSGARICRACEADKKRRYKARKRARAAATA